MGNIYSITVQGTTYSGNTSFPSAETLYWPIEGFELPGFVAIEAPIPAGNAGFTDPNVLDAFLMVGSPLDTNVLAGELQWGSNSATHSEFSDGNISQALAAIDETTQEFDPLTNTLTITIPDATTAMISQLDTFTKASNLISTPAEIVGGIITLDFSPDWTTLVGSATFYGNGFIEPGSSAWSASFSGAFTQNYQGLAEV
ncbi:MAG: hypothetical protein AAFO04_29285 [Cyanobacteria bacterium J06592_8]